MKESVYTCMHDSVAAIKLWHESLILLLCTDVSQTLKYSCNHEYNDHDIGSSFASMLSMPCYERIMLLFFH